MAHLHGRGLPDGPTGGRAQRIVDYLATRTASDRRLHACTFNTPEERYVLVGHSLSGAFVRLFAVQHDASVAGLVLVDAVHERKFEAIDSLPTSAQRAAGAGMRPISREGIDVEEVFAELRQQSRAIPYDLVVVARGVPLASDEMPPDWTPEQRRRGEAIRVALQEELSRLSPNGRLIVATRSGHFVHHDEPTIVVAAVRSVVEQARARRVR